MADAVHREPERERGSRRPIVDAIFCALGALALFLLAATTPLESFGKYSVAAAQWLDGRLPAERMIDFSPLYLWLNIALERLGLAPERLLEALQIGLAALAVALLFSLLEPRVGRRLAFLGAGVFALDPHLVIYQRILEPELVLLTALLGTLLLLERSATRSGPRAGLGAGFGAGLLAAVAILTRPTFLPIFCAVPLFFYLRERGQPDGEKQWSKLSALFLAPLLVAGILLGVHAGSPFAPVMNPGTVFFEGNQPLSRGTSAIYPPLVLESLRAGLDVPDAAHAHYRQVARAAPDLARNAPPAEVNRLWAERALTFLGAHPAAAFERLGTKLRYAFHGYRWHDVPSASRYDRRLRWFSLPFSILAALALVGLAAAARDWRSALGFYGLFAVQLAVMLVFYVSARQRLVLLPAAVYFALLGLRTIRASQWRWAAGALVAVLALALALPDDAMRDATYQQRGYLEAGPLMASLAGGAVGARSDEVVRAMAAMPWWVDWMRPAFVPQDERTLDERLAEELLARRGDGAAFTASSADFDLAQALLRVERAGEARPILEALIAEGFLAYRGSRAPSDPRLLLAEIEARAGEEERAIRQIEAALAERPADPFALTTLAVLDPARESTVLAELDRTFGEPDRRWLYGRTLRRLGHAKRAAEQLAPLAAALPELRALRVELGLALGQARDLDGAASQLLAANRLQLEPVLEVRSVAEIVGRWVDAHPDEPEIQMLAAELLEQHGFPAEAAKLYASLEARSDLSPEIESRLQKGRSSAP